MRLNQVRIWHFLVVQICLLTLILSGCGDSSRTENDGWENESVSITLLHTNDTHSRLESFTPFGEPLQGGVARRKTLINTIRQDEGVENVLLVDAGDFVQGTLFYNAWEGSADIMALNDLGYDAVTLGNHEFDLGPEKLGRALRGEDIDIAGVTYPTEALSVPLVSTNLNVDAEPALVGLVQPSLVVSKGGGDFAVLGVVTETSANISNPGDLVVINNYIDSVQQEIDRLTAQGINKIILLSHAGYGVDVQVAPQLTGVDMIVSGHDHPLLLPEEAYTSGAPAEFLAERVVGDYPRVTADSKGDPVLIVGAYEWGKILGRIDVTFNASGIITDYEGAPILIDESIVEEPALAAKVALYKEPIDALSSVIIGSTDTVYSGARNPGLRSQEMPLGNLVADTMLAAGQTYDSAVAALTNGGGIRADLPGAVVGDAPYDVTFGDALTVLPFGNTIVALDVSGAQLVEALDNGLSWALNDARDATLSSGAFPQIAGMTVEFCGTTIADIQANTLPPAACPGALRTGGVVTDLNVDGLPVDLNATYRIVTNNFMAGGGDYYSSLAEACTNIDGYCVDTGIVMLDALIEEFTNHSPVNRTIEGRLTAQP